jgi:hypothetical protein
LAVDQPAGVITTRSPPVGIATADISISAPGRTKSEMTVVRAGAFLGKVSRHTSVMAAASAAFFK